MHHTRIEEADSWVSTRQIKSVHQGLLGDLIARASPDEMNSVILSIAQRLAHQHAPGQMETIQLDFTQNPGKVMDDITLVRSHWWLMSEGFSLSTANSDVQKLPATLYHRIADSLAYAA